MMGWGGGGNDGVGRRRVMMEEVMMGWGGGWESCINCTCLSSANSQK